MKISRIIYALLIAVLVIATTSCAYLAKAEKEAVKLVNKYCSSMTQKERGAFRERVNEIMQNKGHSVIITCKGDV
jgi:hypothetical protein